MAGDLNGLSLCYVPSSRQIQTTKQYIRKQDDIYLSSYVAVQYSNGIQIPADLASACLTI